MTLARPVALAGALFAAALLLAACGGGGDSDDPDDSTPTATATAAPVGDGDNEAFTVQSSDGTVTLEVPPGALPDGVDLGVLSVEALPLDELFVDAPPEIALATVRLEPSGITFNAPVTVRTRIAGPLLPEFALLISDDGEVESVTLETVEEDDDGVIVVSEIGHFSDLLYMGGTDVIKFEFVPPLENHAVGETLTLRARISRLNFEHELSMVVRSGEDIRLVRLRPSDDPDWDWDVGIRIHGAASVVESDEPIEEGSVRDGRSAVFTERMAVCDRAGGYIANVGGYAKVGARVIPIDPPAEPFEMRGDMSYGDFLEEGATCVAPATETPTVIATSTQTPLETPTPVPTQTETPPPTETPTETPTPNRPPVVSAISATTALPVTTYVIEVSDPDGDALTFVWTGPNCGSATGSTTSTMKWSHGSEDCPHDTVEHADATITVVVSGAEWRVTCSYGGAASGTGKACAAPVRSP